LIGIGQIIEASRAWRDSWRDILGTQQRLLHGFQTMYSPIIGANEEYTGHEPVITPQHIMERTTKLNAAYDELRTDLLEEVAGVDTRIIKPAQEAKDCIQPMKKVIKKRGDKKVRRDGRWKTAYHTADDSSWTSKSIRRGSIQGGRRQRDQKETMHLWRRPRWN